MAAAQGRVDTVNGLEEYHGAANSCEVVPLPPESNYMGVS